MIAVRKAMDKGKNKLVLTIALCYISHFTYMHNYSIIPTNSIYACSHVRCLRLYMPSLYPLTIAYDTEQDVFQYLPGA